MDAICSGGAGKQIGEATLGEFLTASAAAA